jgi:hypothetical protein
MDCILYLYCTCLSVPYSDSHVACLSVPACLNVLYSLYQGVTKRCRLSRLTNSALVYELKCVGGGGRVTGCQPMNTAVHKEPNKPWRSDSIFCLCSVLFVQYPDLPILWLVQLVLYLFGMSYTLNPTVLSIEPSCPVHCLLIRYLILPVL